MLTPMHLRFWLRFPGYIVGSDPEQLDLSLDFEDRHFRVGVKFEGDGQPVQMKDVAPEKQWFRSSNAVNFRLDPTDSKSKAYLASLGQTDESYFDLAKLLCSIANRVFIAIRNFGLVPHISEVRFDEDNPRRQLRRFHVELEDAPGVWKSFVEWKGLQDLIEAFETDVVSSREIPAHRWRDISEALQFHLTAGPEQEFMTNSLEFLRLGNWRMSVMEAVIGIEINLNTYLRLRLDSMGVPKDGINSFVTPQLGLTNRIGVVLRLADDDDKVRAWIPSVLQGVKWRNDIVHKKGRLPDQLTEAQIRTAVGDVIGLTHYLAYQIKVLEVQPRLDIVGADFSKKYGVPRPKIHFFPDYNVIVGITTPSLPDNSTVDEITNNLSNAFRFLDPRFTGRENLSVAFIDEQGKFLAHWEKGTLTIR